MKYADPKDETIIEFKSHLSEPYEIASRGGN